MPERHPLPLLTEAVPRLPLTRSNTCLLLQDLHAPFADASTGWLAARAQQKVLRREFDEYYDALDLVTPNIANIVARCRELGFPLLYSCLGYLRPAEPSGFQTATGWQWELSGSHGTFPDSWQPAPDDLIVPKPGWGALANAKVEHFLQDRRIQTVIIMGTLFEFGIRQTCLELMDRGYPVLVVSDGVIPLTQSGRAQAAGELAHGMVKLRSAGELTEILARLEAHGQVEV